MTEEEYIHLQMMWVTAEAMEDEARTWDQIARAKKKKEQVRHLAAQKRPPAAAIAVWQNQAPTKGATEKKEGNNPKPLTKEM